MSPDSNGDHVTRSELGAHMRAVRAELGAMRDNQEGVKEDVKEIRNEIREFRHQTGEDVKAIRNELGAGPRWMGARANAVVDKVLPVLLTLAALWVLGERFS